MDIDFYLNLSNFIHTSVLV